MDVVRDVKLAPEVLVTSSPSETHFPVYVTKDGFRVYKVKLSFYESEVTTIHLPLWIVYSNINPWLRDSTASYIEAIDSNTGKKVVVVITSTLDRRRLARTICHKELFTHMCDANWFINYSQAMYCTGDYVNGYQFYVVLPGDYKLAIRGSSRHLMNEFKIQQEYYRQQATKAKLSPIAYKVFTELIQYLSQKSTERFFDHGMKIPVGRVAAYESNDSDHKSPELYPTHNNSNYGSTNTNMWKLRNGSLNGLQLEGGMQSTLRVEGLTLMHRLFAVQEMRLPPNTPSLKRLSTVATALCICDINRVDTLPLPTRIREEVQQMASKIFYKSPDPILDEIDLEEMIPVPGRPLSEGWLASELQKVYLTVVGRRDQSHCIDCSQELTSLTKRPRLCFPMPEELSFGSPRSDCSEAGYFSPFEMLDSDPDSD